MLTAQDGAGEASQHPMAEICFIHSFIRATSLLTQGKDFPEFTPGFENVPDQLLLTGSGARHKVDAGARLGSSISCAIQRVG